ncbi:MAG: heparin lyase I family protein, partial [Solirubrobacterales bacterium]
MALAFALAVCSLSAASLPAAAQAGDRGTGSCKRVVLRVAKHRVSDRSWVRFRGRVCRALSGKPKVRIRIRRKKGWKTAAKVRSRANGRFRGRVRVRARGRRVVRIRATAKRRKSKMLRLRIDPNGCALRHPGADIGMALSGCRLVASDTAERADARPFWGKVECGTLANPDLSRQRLVGSGGDAHPSATGAAQGDSSFRHLTLLDGDDYYDERCELGANDHESGPTAFYREGQRRATFVSMRLPQNFPLEAEDWQTVLQMKQAQPSDGGGGVPILYMGASEDEWTIDSFNGVYASFPAQRGVWTRFAFDVYYSQDPNRGWLQVSVDLNGDGDFDDAGERTPVIRTNTLKTETAGDSSDGLAPGDPIPSHLRTGIYHKDTIPCP